MTYWKYIRSDSLRCIKSCRCLLGVGGVFLTLLFANIGNQSSQKSVVFMARYIMDGIPFFLCMIFAVISFADSLCEDVKSRYYRLEIIRGETSTYCSTRTLTVFFSAFFSVMLGFLLFVFFLKMNFPWKLKYDTAYDASVNSGAFKTVLKAGHYVLYYMLASVQLGILAGDLALFSACISLKIKNRLLVYTVPVVSFYFLANATYRLPMQLGWLDLYKVFIPSYNVWGNDLFSFLWALFVGALLAVLLRALLFYQIKGALEHE